MIDVEREIREALWRHDDDVPRVLDEVPLVARRARRRQLANVGGGAVLALALGAAAYVGLDALERTQGIPAIPTPSPVTGPSGATGPGVDEKGIDVFTIDSATGDASLLWNATTNASEPDRFPDGSTLIYARKGGGEGGQIFAVGPDRVERQLTFLEGGASSPAWSPDGTRIAFTGGEVAGENDVYVMNADGSDVRRVADVGSADAHPEWSPDGERIVFLAGTGTSAETGGAWIVTLADGSLTHVTDGSEGDGDQAPTWSPTGEWIAFIRFEDAPGPNLEADDSDIWLVRPDGSDAHRLLDAEGPLEIPPGVEGDEFSSAGTPDGHWQSAPTWSPDGTKLAWGDIHYGVRIAEVATQEITLITTTMWYDLDWDEAGLIGTQS